MTTRTMKAEARRAGISLALAFAWCAVTFGGGWILGLVVAPGKPLFMFWAGMAYLWGLQKFMPSNVEFGGDAPLQGVASAGTQGSASPSRED